MTTVGRRSFLRCSALAAGLVGGGAVLAACGDDSGSGGSYGREALRLSGVGDTEFAGEYLADSRGYYREAGFDGIDLLAGGPATTSVEAGLVAGRCWAGLSDPLPTAVAIVRGAPLTIVGATYQRNPVAVVSRASDPLLEPRAMIGRRIGVRDAGDRVWTALLAAHAIEPGRITRVRVGDDPTPLITGGIDGYLGSVTREPNLLKVAGYATASFLVADHGLPLVAQTVTVRRATVDTEREKLTAFLRAEVRGWTDAVADPVAATRLAVGDYGRGLGLDENEQLLEAADRNSLVVSDETRAHGLFTVSDRLVEENLAALSLFGVAVGREQLFDSSLLTEVFAADPGLRGDPHR